ncbi:hypothetical protein K1719_008056 [Acacia pycnantha]|nr:hypothetical protein K1719_008056 [Acacia pycnantha]
MWMSVMTATPSAPTSKTRSSACAGSGSARPRSHRQIELVHDDPSALGLGHCFECNHDDSTRIAAAIGVQFLHTGILPGLYSNYLKITDILMAENKIMVGNETFSSVVRGNVQFEDLTKQVTVPSSKPKYRHDFYQKPDEVIVTIFAKGVRPDYIVVYFEEQMLSVSINVPGEDVYNFQPRLFGKIICSKCQYYVLPTKIEIRLAKAEPIPWTSLEYSNEIAVLPSGSGSTCTSSTPTRVDWDKLEAHVKKGDEEGKLDGDAALEKYFREIYQDADEDTRQIKKSYDLGPDWLRLLRTRDFLHLILSYPMRIGYEDILKKWIYNASQISLRRGLKHILYDDSPLRYVQAVIPQDIATKIINGGRVSSEKPLKQVPQPIILLATHLALHQLTLTLTSDTIPYSRRALDKKIQNIRFSAINDAEKRTVVENIRANSQIRATFGDLEIFDLNHIDDQTQREKALLNLATRRRSQLVLVVDGDGDKKLDPQKVILPINRDSKNVVVFVTTRSSAWQNDYLSINVDLTVKTEDHLLPWELFCKIVGGELLHSSIAIQEIALQIVEKCGGHLLAIILIAQSLKHVTDAQTWELALKKLRYREAIVNAFLFNIIWANVNCETKKFRLLRCLMTFKSLDGKMTSDDELFDRWFSEQLVDTKDEAKSILQNFMECSLLLQFEDTPGRHNIQLPEDIKIILHAMGEEIPENLSEGALESTISDLQVLNLSNAHMQNLYAVNTGDDVKELNLEGCMEKRLPEAIFKLQKLETLSLEHCSQLLELPPQIAQLKNLKQVRLSGCERLETLPQEFWELPNLEVCDLSGTHITDLPPSLNFSNLSSLLLGTNLNLMKIPSSFFDEVPLLTVLDLSHTSIRELPRSIFNLKQLTELYLKDCEYFVELSPEIGQLTSLTTLDLDGTFITHLPKEVEELTNLESLSLSFYDDDSSCAVIPLGVLSKLTKLKVLRIDVNSDNEWWSKHVDDILKEIKGLKMLQALDMYIPSDRFSNPIEKRLSNFRFIIGRHKPRMISHIPLAIEAMFKESSRSLKFVNGINFPNEVKTILSEAWAFFLHRHMTIKNLTELMLKNLEKLQLCILAECNEMQSIVDVDEKPLCIQFLTIFYLKNLISIIDKPIYGRPIFRELKLLALHTCPELTTIFTMDSLHSLVSLEELIVEDCPKVSCIISCSSSKRTTNFYLPRLRKLSILFVPELASISNGVRIGGNLEQIGLYYCPKLLSLSPAELSSKQLKVIRGETEWWKNLEWREEAGWRQEEDPASQFNKFFSPIDEDLDILSQLTSFYKIEGSGELEFCSEESDSEVGEVDDAFGEVDDVVGDVV